MIEKRKINARNSETKENRCIRLEYMHRRFVTAVDEGTEEETHVRLNCMREMIPWKKKENSAYHYNPHCAYEADSIVDIGFISFECIHCHALRFKGESPGMCCCNGKIKLDQLQRPPEPLNGLLCGTDNRSKEFLQAIRTYNNAFQMTSFGAHIVSEGNFMPTFKIQGQCYHLAGSLLPVDGNQPKFLQIYFTAAMEAQRNQRCENYPNLRHDIVDELQNMLHLHNNYVRSFKVTMERQTA